LPNPNAITGAVGEEKKRNCRTESEKRRKSYWLNLDSNQELTEPKKAQRNSKDSDQISKKTTGKLSIPTFSYHNRDNKKKLM